MVERAEKGMLAEKKPTVLTMQVVVSFPGLEYPDVVFEAAAESLVADVLQAAADEWGTDAGFLELSFLELVLPLDSLLMSSGVEGGSELVASLRQVFGREWLTDRAKRARVMQHLSNLGEQNLSLDTPSFVKDGSFLFDMVWVGEELIVDTTGDWPRIVMSQISDDFRISFVNPHPSITSASFRGTEFLESFPVSYVDLTGIRSITSTGDGFLPGCRFVQLDISCLSRLITIGDSFLYSCASLSSLDLTSLSNVTSVGACFLGECESLSALDLTSFVNVTEIGMSFLEGCSSLSSLDLTCLSNVTAIGANFLEGCESLSSLDLTGFGNVKTVGENFLDTRSSLTLSASSLSVASEAVRERVRARRY